MNKKILFALSVALVAIAAIGTVSAFDLSDLGSLLGMEPENQTVTVDGENFTIPGTFEENEQVNDTGTDYDFDFFKCTQYSKGYVNGTNYINILINDYDINPDDDLINFNNGISKEISGENGFLDYDGIGYTFSYAKDNKVISIQSDNEELIAPVIA